MSNLETKSLSSLETSNSLNDGDKILIERDGDMVRIDSSAIGNNNIEIPVPDWNVNDSSTPGYIANRPFYTTYGEEKTILESTEITFDQAGMPGLVYVQNLDANFQNLEDLKAGDYIIITVDGIKHEFVAQWDGSSPNVYVGGQHPGDSKVLENGVGVSFTYTGGVAPDARIYVANQLLLAGEIGSTHTISITRKEYAVTKMSSNYVDSIFRVTVAKKSNGTIVSNYTYNDIIDALNKGKNVIVNSEINHRFYSLSYCNYIAVNNLFISTGADIEFSTLYIIDSSSNNLRASILSFKRDGSIIETYKDLTD